MVTTCSICGTTEAVDPGEFSKCLLRDIMEERKCCFHCAFWINHLGLYKNDPKWLVINGASWIVHPFVPASERGRSFIGCGGRGKLSQKMVENFSPTIGGIKEIFRRGF